MKQIIRALFHKYKPAFLYYRPVFIFCAPERGGTVRWLACILDWELINSAASPATPLTATHPQE